MAADSHVWQHAAAWPEWNAWSRLVEIVQVPAHRSVQVPADDRIVKVR